MRDTHTWVHVGGNNYTCANCPARGRQLGSAWPPIRTADFVMGDTCQEVRKLQRDKELKQLGVDPSEVTE